MREQKGDLYFKLLSKLMSDEQSENVINEIDVNEIYNELYDIFDTQLMSGIEKIQYDEKYEIVEKLRNVFEEYRLLFYYPELIFKNVICFYEKPKIMEKLLSAYQIEQCDNGFMIKPEWFPLDIPVIFGARENGTYGLNIPGVITCLDSKEVAFLQRLSRKGFEIHTLLSMLSIPLHKGNEAIEFIAVPKTKSKYSDSIKAYADIVIIDEKAYDDFKHDSSNGCFENIKKIYVDANSELLINKIQNDFPKIVIAKYTDEQNLMIRLEEDNTYQDNTGLSKRVAELVNRNSKFLTDNLLLEKKRIQNITSNIFENLDESTVEKIRKLKKENVLINKSNEDLFKSLAEINSKLISIADQLEQFALSYFIESMGRAERQFDLAGFIKHSYEGLLDQNLFLQYLSICQIANTKDNKEQLKKYGDAVSMQGEDFREAVNLNIAKPNDSYTYRNSVQTFITKEFDDEFLTRIQISLGINTFGYKDTNILNLLMRKIKHIYDDYRTSEEFFLAGLYCEQLAEQPKMAMEHYRIAMGMGNIYAGENYYLLAVKKEWDVSTAELSRKLVPSACYDYGMELFHNGSKEAGVDYLKLSAGLGNKTALTQLAGYYSEKIKARIEMYSAKLKEEPKKGKDVFATTDDYDSIAKTVFKAINKQTGRMYNVELGYLAFINKEFDSAIKYFQETHGAIECVFLGSIYRFGLGCAVDKSRALGLFNEANNKGNELGRIMYADLKKELDREKDKERANSMGDYAAKSEYSYSTYDYSSSSGCVIEGTEILFSDGSIHKIESISKDARVLNCVSGISYTSDELVVNDQVDMLYSVNEDKPFMSLEHAILTDRGWCSLNPDLAMSINPCFKVSMLKVGDRFVKRMLVNGKIESIECVVKTINVVENINRRRCYDLHFYSGDNSYYANGYPCLLNYPLVTISQINKKLKNMDPERQREFSEMAEIYRSVLDNLFGKTNIGLLLDAVERSE